MINQPGPQTTPVGSTGEKSGSGYQYINTGQEDPFIGAQPTANAEPTPSAGMAVPSFTESFGGGKYGGGWGQDYRDASGGY